MNVDAPALARAVLNDDAGAVRRSMAMKLRRELSPPVFVAVARRLRISAQIIFFQRREGVGLGKGARACGKSCHFECLEKKQVAKK